MSCVTSLGETLGSLCLVSLRLHPRSIFPFADFTVDPFTVINHSLEYNYTLSPVSPPSESSTLGQLWEPSAQVTMGSSSHLAPGMTLEDQLP